MASPRDLESKFWTRSPGITIAGGWALGGEERSADPGTGMAAPDGPDLRGRAGGGGHAGEADPSIRPGPASRGRRDAASAA
jgi:hypothetical protein